MFLRSYSLPTVGRIVESCLRVYSSVSHNQTGSKFDIVIGGGGIMGCSSSYFLAKKVSPSSICIIERDIEVRLHY